MLSLRTIALFMGASSAYAACDQCNGDQFCDNTETCVQKLDVDEVCLNEADCKDDLRCEVTADPEKTCINVKNVNEDCTNLPDNICKYGLTCDRSSSPNRCLVTQEAKLGESCADLSCECCDLFCETGSNQCASQKADGFSCTSFIECQNSCNDGICGARPAGPCDGCAAPNVCNSATDDKCIAKLPNGDSCAGGDGYISRYDKQDLCVSGWCKQGEDVCSAPLGLNASGCTNDFIIYESGARNKNCLQQDGGVTCFLDSCQLFLQEGAVCQGDFTANYDLFQSQCFGYCSDPNGTSIDSVCKQSLKACFKDFECGYYKKCAGAVGLSEGACVTACNGDYDCSDGKFCDDGGCASQGGAGAKCSTDKGCLGEFFCKASTLVCTEDLETDEACNRDEQCNSKGDAITGGVCDIEGSQTCQVAFPLTNILIGIGVTFLLCICCCVGICMFMGVGCFAAVKTVNAPSKQTNNPHLA